MHQVGARFLAESEIWMAAEATVAAPPAEAAPERRRAMAPLGETAAAHMGAPEIGRFLAWRERLPKGVAG